MASEPSLLALLDHHRRMNEIFLEYQEALMLLDWDRAESLLSQFRRHIEVHIRFEEDRLLPLYRDRAGERPGGGVNLFAGEHLKIKQFLASFADLTREVRAKEKPRRAVLSLFDRHAMFKHLMEHHDLRERNTLYPAVDEVTTPTERSALLRELSRYLAKSPAQAR